MKTPLSNVLKMKRTKKGGKEDMTKRRLRYFFYYLLLSLYLKRYIA